jgi:hypothetical protein
MYSSVIRDYILTILPSRWIPELRPQVHWQNLEHCDRLKVSMHPEGPCCVGFWVHSHWHMGEKANQ